jgi:hypothetical protein
MKKKEKILKLNNSLLSEESLVKEWLNKEEDKAGGKL